MHPPIDIKFLEEKLPKFKIPDLYFPWPVDSREGGLKIKRPVFKEILQKIIFATE
ncbi:MAG: hypothetical protein GY757_43745 [bacterium]|nr:hypothetical protein [bacterium]